MKIRASIVIGLFAGVLLLSGCASLQYTVVRTVPEGATVEGKRTYVSDVEPYHREDEPYTYIGETPLVVKWSCPERIFGTYYVSFRISKPGFYPVERTYRTEDVPEKIEIQLESMR